MEPFQQMMGARIAQAALIPFLAALIGGGIFFARRNLRLGRGDRRNAGRLAIYFLDLSFIGGILGSHHVLAPRELDQVLIIAGLSLLIASVLWLLYTAIEPFVRRQWPHILISWTRFLSGEFRDPLVGRDILVGCAGGILMNCIFQTPTLLPSWLGFAPPNPPLSFSFQTVMGIRSFNSSLLSMFASSFVGGLAYIFLVFLMRILLRSQKAAVVASVLIAVLLQGPGSLWLFAVLLIIFALLFFVQFRFGLVAAAFIVFSVNLLGAFPVTLDVSA